ncbi:MAG: TetR/AcrR family transcriptional regulator [Pseudomonadales bacterium]|jgi:TetR/AcrR family transcriptional repressor of mexJK operon|nr:TetR/AcrR family transcriptional regulator [Pseudomonadales bacterium]
MATSGSSPKPRSTDKREEVLDIASENFRVKGFDGTSINVMAREAGISKESIYRYFGSKEDLFLAVVERELSVYHQNMLETARGYQGQPLREALYAVADAVLRVASNDRTLALRRLIFQMSANGSKVGHHYFTSGPDVAYQSLLKLFGHYQPSASFSADQLSRYFTSMVLHRTMLQRECGVLAPLSDEEIKQASIATVDDFLLAFCKLPAAKP